MKSWSVYYYHLLYLQYLPLRCPFSYGYSPLSRRCFFSCEWWDKWDAGNDNPTGPRFGGLPGLELHHSRELLRLTTGYKWTRNAPQSTILCFSREWGRKGRGGVEVDRQRKDMTETEQYQTEEEEEEEEAALGSIFIFMTWLLSTETTVQ